MLNFISGFILGFCVLYTASIQYKEIVGLLKSIHALLKEEKKAEPEAFVTRGAAAFTNENMVGQESSSIVNPKTPQQVAWEEEQELDKINLRRPK